MKPILEIQNVSKSFRILHDNQPYLSLRDSIASIFRRSASSSEIFWALKEISFQVKQGESIGIIGKNGAGKSTLLKILSKITPPTSGKIVVRGRIASLLEVGTGFHPELSGRENVFLNGSILGMKRAEISKKFDEIIDFSGTEKFLDTPLKHYSSGMQLRLAFAVAAFLEPEIMIIDEVLAVGDAEFQRKCIGKMEDVSRSGRTILFVSHDLNAVQTLCSSVIHLEHGQIKASGETASIISGYLNSQSISAEWSASRKKEQPYFEKISIALKGEQPSLKLEIKFRICSPGTMRNSFVAFNIATGSGAMVGQAIPELDPFISIENAEAEFVSEIDLNGFVPGDYMISAWVGPHFNETYDWQKGIAGFTIVDSPQKKRTFPHPPAHGAIVPSSRIIS
ncbi:MAG TPA: ABC transporter ATP-binding protein [Bacteroidia bacterium]|jgi:lipopolysaccharide transport system ATP-binding protein|nr:ABC transporter ATP-binding protein [Bacteroidia bacterium]